MSRTARHRRLPALATAAAALASLVTLSQASLSGAAFTGDTANPGALWQADVVQPPGALTTGGICGSVGSPQVAGSTSADLNGSVVALTVPAGTQAGDLLLAHIVNDNESTGPTGFSLLLETQDAGNFQGRVYQRLATATDAGTTYTFSPTGTKGSGGLVVVRGAADLVAAADAAGSIVGSKTSAVIAPSMNVAQAGSLLLAFYGVKQSGVAFTAPPGMTRAFPNVGTKGTSNEAFVESRAAGPTGTRTAPVSDPKESIGQSVVIRPAGAGASVALSWAPSGSTFTTGYAVLRDGQQIAVVDASTSTWTDPAPTASSHTYAVVTTAGSWQSQPATATATSESCSPPP